MSHEIDDDSSKIVYHAHVTPGRVLKLTKLAAYHTSEVVPASELADRCSRTLGRARVRGVEDLHRTQRDWYDHFWDRADVEVEGPAVERWTRAIAGEHGYGDISHTLEIFGTCRTCAAA